MTAVNEIQTIVFNMKSDKVASKDALQDHVNPWKNFDYDFLLVEGVGQVNTKLEPTIAAANVSDLHSVIIAVLMLRKLPASLEFNKEKTGTGAARVNFTLKKGKYKKE